MERDDVGSSGLWARSCRVVREGGEKCRVHIDECFGIYYLCGSIAWEEGGRDESSTRKGKGGIRAERKGGQRFKHKNELILRYEKPTRES